MGFYTYFANSTNTDIGNQDFKILVQQSHDLTTSRVVSLLMRMFIYCKTRMFSQTPVSLYRLKHVAYATNVEGKKKKE